ncbi:hypothetical protein [Saccharopolyspora pogona]|uniref:hypothetical protein n=1 Tax=Saccharopolyspora pogona TaxID=333966 RepID=UPI001CC24C41|nr:hypothetical protein [Saccharopolyspora pogona]
MADTRVLLDRRGWAAGLVDFVRVRDDPQGTEPRLHCAAAAELMGVTPAERRRTHVDARLSPG